MNGFSKTLTEAELGPLACEGSPFVMGNVSLALADNSTNSFSSVAVAKELSFPPWITQSQGGFFILDKKDSPEVNPIL